MRVCLAGATGWAGSELARGIAATSDLQLVAAVARKSAGQLQPVVLTLKYPENALGAEGNQVWVDELVAEGWLARGR